jgi:hypothetical protein
MSDSLYAGAKAVIDCAKRGFQRRWKISWNEESERVFVKSCWESGTAERNDFSRSVEIVVYINFALTVSENTPMTYLQVDVRVDAFVF